MTSSGQLPDLYSRPRVSCLASVRVIISVAWPNSRLQVTMVWSLFLPQGQLIGLHYHSQVSCLAFIRVTGQLSGLHSRPHVSCLTSICVFFFLDFIPFLRSHSCGLNLLDRALFLDVLRRGYNKMSSFRLDLRRVANCAACTKAMLPT